MGQRVELSFFDKKRINQLFCSEHTVLITYSDENVMMLMWRHTQAFQPIVVATQHSAGMVVSRILPTAPNVSVLMASPEEPVLSLPYSTQVISFPIIDPFTTPCNYFPYITNLDCGNSVLNASDVTSFFASHPLYGVASYLRWLECLWVITAQVQCHHNSLFATLAKIIFGRWLKNLLLFCSISARTTLTSFRSGLMDSSVFGAFMTSRVCTGWKSNMKLTWANQDPGIFIAFRSFLGMSQNISKSLKIKLF